MERFSSRIIELPGPGDAQGRSASFHDTRPFGAAATTAQGSAGVRSGAVAFRVRDRAKPAKAAARRIERQNEVANQAAARSPDRGSRSSRNPSPACPLFGTGMRGFTDNAFAYSLLRVRRGLQPPLRSLRYRLCGII